MEEAQDNVMVNRMQKDNNDHQNTTQTKLNKLATLCINSCYYKT